MNIQRQLTKVNLLVAFAALVCFNHVASAQRPININKVILGNQYVNGEAKGGYAGSIFSPTDHVIYWSMLIGHWKTNSRSSWIQKSSPWRPRMLNSCTSLNQKETLFAAGRWPY